MFLIYIFKVWHLPFIWALSWFCVERNMTAFFAKFTLKYSTIWKWRMCNFWEILFKKSKKSKNRPFFLELEYNDSVYRTIYYKELPGMVSILLAGFHYEQPPWGKLHPRFCLNWMYNIITSQINTPISVTAYGSLSTK